MLAQYAEQYFEQKSVLLLHDQGRPRFAAATVEALRQVKFEILPHPSPCSPHLAP